jgi:hypothetical protein
VYTFSFNVGEKPQLALNRNTGFVFKGTLKTETGPSTAPCTYTCTNVQPVAARGYLAEPTPSNMSWDVNVVSSNADTVYVDVRMLGGELVPHCAYGCPSSFSKTFYVTPCPLQSPTYCNASTVWVYLPAASTDYKRFALRTGEVYVFTGWIDEWTSQPSMDGPCSEPVECTVQSPPQLVLGFPTVATQPTTWGHVKALFRKE